MSLKKYRQDKGFTQQKLSAVSGVSYALIQKYELGFREISKATVGTVHKLAEALDCSMDALIGFKELEDEIVVQGLKAYIYYDRTNPDYATERLRTYLYKHYRDLKDAVNLDKLTERIIKLYNDLK